MPASTGYKSKYGDWALVLGGSEGLGEALVRDLARRGMNVAMVARREPLLREAAQRVAQDLGVETLPIRADLADPNVLQVLQEALGGIEVSFLVYNCAAEFGGEFLTLDIADHLGNMQVNCIAPTVVIHHFARQMVKRQRGGIVVCSSLASVNGLYYWVSYGASKAYEAILGQGLWYELKDKGVDATTLMVGSTYTPKFQQNQRDRGTIFAECRVPANLPPGVTPPQDPVDASAHLFAQLDKQWIPMVYANPSDEAKADAKMQMSLTDRVTLASDGARRTFSLKRQV